MAMSADRTRGFTGDSQRIQSGDKEVARKNSTVSVIRGRLLANMVETASRAAGKIVRNLDEKKVLSSDCTNCFDRLERDIDVYVKGAASVEPGTLSRIGNPTVPVTWS